MGKRLKKLRNRLRELNRKIRNRRRRGHKTPDLAAERKRVKKKIDWLEKHTDPGPVPNLETLDGHQVPGWIAEILKAARNSGNWEGYVISGYRTPAYSESLCRAMCGAPSCPGRCAGRSSNHACPPSGKGSPYEGAVDVTDSAGLQRYCRAHNHPLHGNGEMLPYDTPHFSNTGR